MEIACPACKKLNSGSGACERCSCDLEPLREILRAAEGELQKARSALLSCAGRRSLLYARTSWELKHSDEAAKAAFFSCLLIGNNEEASRWYYRAAAFVT